MGNKVCTFCECDRPAVARGLCITHYKQRQSGGELQPIRVRMQYGSVCSFPMCGKDHYCFGLCRGHYDQRRRGSAVKVIKKRGGDPEKRFWRKVDRESGGCWLWTGQKYQGYGRMRLPGGKMVQSHRFSYCLHHKMQMHELPPELSLDHRCRNRACVNPDHLDLVTAHENAKRMLAWKAMCSVVASQQAEIESLRRLLEGSLA
jgi:hypothetical protein